MPGPTRLVPALLAAALLALGGAGCGGGSGSSSVSKLTLAAYSTPKEAYAQIIPAFAYLLLAVINPQSFNWTIDFHPPYELLGALIAILIGLAVITAILSGREAMGIGPVRAVREDW